MKQKLIHLSLFLFVTALLVITVSFAGSLTPPGSPSKTMKSLSDLYQLVNTGANTPSTDFTTPGTILPTMNTIGDTYDLLNTKIGLINTSKANVLTGTTFFGIAGTMTNNGAINITPSAVDQAIPVGYHNGSGIVSGDADLVVGNIKSGVDIFGVAGTVIQSLGDAAVGNVLAGKHFSNATTANVLGTMIDNTASADFTPAAIDVAIPVGFYDGVTKISGDADLVVGNIKSGVDIFGVTGTLSVGGLPKTNQLSCWSGVGVLISCAGTGQDGDTRKGIATSYTDNANGTITDNVTTLIWQKQDDAVTRSWVNALAYCNANTAALPGSGWRLPNNRELSSIVNFENSSPAIDSTYFPSTQSNYYWSSSTLQAPGFQSYAWNVAFAAGNVGSYNKTLSYYVRCVR